jgi:hypothetical protein
VILTDHVRFIVPQSREYQFAAMTVIQRFVNGYDEKMRLNHVLPTSSPFELHYELHGLPDEDWKFWQAIGLKLTKMPEPVERCDMEIDMREEQVLQFYAFDRHVCQAYGSSCGVEVSPLPEIRTVTPFLMRDVDGYGTSRLERVLWLDNMDEDVAEGHLMEAEDDEFSCVVGERGWLTWWAVAMGLPTIEILKPDESVPWMSKWSSPLYRVIEENHKNLLHQSIHDLADVTLAVARHKEMKKQREAIPA